MTLEKLYKIIQNRQKKPPDNSYVASLFKQGKKRIAQKVGEEAIEVVLAATGKDKKKVINEMADLWFHLLVLLAVFDINPRKVMETLERRHQK